MNFDAYGQLEPKRCVRKDHGGRRYSKVMRGAFMPLRAGRIGQLGTELLQREYAPIFLVHLPIVSRQR